MSRASRSEKVMADRAKVFAAISRAADAGRVCPSNLDIAALLDCGISHSSKVISDLEGDGLIEVQRGGANRVVTIVATGKRTAGVVTRQHWSERGVKKFVPPLVGRPVAPLPERRFIPRVSRDPCPRCGTRADIGCAHSIPAIHTDLSTGARPAELSPQSVHILPHVNLRSDACVGRQIEIID